MRLACENCAAVYLIDDAAMTARGVRAMCPRCKSIQFVPSVVGAELDSAAQAAPMANPISASHPPVPDSEPEAPGKSPVARVALTTRMVARPPAPPPEALTLEGPEARAELFGEMRWNEGDPSESEPGGPLVPASAAPVSAAAEFTASAAVAPPPPVPAARPPPVSLPPDLPPPPPAQSSFTLDELLGPEPASGDGPAVVSPAGTCASCEGPLQTLEDVASGVCAACREAASARLAPAPVVAPPPAPSLPDVAPEPRTTTRPPPRRIQAAPRRVSATPPARRGWMVIAALAAVVLTGAGALLWLGMRGGAPSPASLRPRERRVDPSGPLPRGLAERVEAWRVADPGPRPSAAEALHEAQREIALDQPAAYASAERRLQAALVDAPRNPELLGTWLTAVALGLDPGTGEHFALDPATLSTIGSEREARALRLWNRHP